MIPSDLFVNCDHNRLEYTAKRSYALSQKYIFETKANRFKPRAQPDGTYSFIAGRQPTWPRCLLFLRFRIVAFMFTRFIWCNLLQNHNIRMQGSDTDDPKATKTTFLLRLGSTTTWPCILWNRRLQRGMLALLLLSIIAENSCRPMKSCTICIKRSLNARLD